MDRNGGGAKSVQPVPRVLFKYFRPQGRYNVIHLEPSGMGVWHDYHQHSLALASAAVVMTRRTEGHELCEHSANVSTFGAASAASVVMSS